MANLSKNKANNLASATVIRRNSGQMSFLFKNINEEKLIDFINKHGNAIEFKYRILFSVRDSGLNPCVPFSDYILIRPLAANGKTVTSIRMLSVTQSLAVRNAVKELVTFCNLENQVTNSVVDGCTAKTKTNAQILSLRAVRQHFDLSDIQFQKVEELIDGFKPKLQFEDGAQYVHSSGKYRYYAVKQESGDIILFNLSRGAKISSLNDDPHGALSKGVIKKVTYPTI